MRPHLYLLAIFMAAACCHQQAVPNTNRGRDGGVSGVAGSEGGEALPSFVSLFQQASPSVVNVSAAHPLPIPGEWLSKHDRELWRALVRSLGSGFVFDNQGHVASCSSVIQDSEDIEVILASGRHLKAKVLATDEISDIAVLSVPQEQAPPPLPLGKSSEVKAGDWVAAFGYPFGLSHTITQGIVSAVRSAEDLRASHGLILTDAAINPGCNGGPLVDSFGRVVGINLIADQTEGSMGLAIPIEDALPLLELLKTGRQPRHPWLGISVQPVGDSLARSFDLPDPEGALVTRVVEDGPADRAGIRSGDVVTSFAGRPVEDPRSLIEAVRKAAMGKEVVVQVFRQGARKSFTVVPRAAP